MEMYITWVALLSFALIMCLYKIGQRLFLQADKRKLEQTGFLTADIVLFLEFILFLLHFLIAEILLTHTNELLASRVLLWVFCLLILVLDDVVLQQKRKQK